MLTITERQDALLRAICVHRERHGFSPTVADLQGIFRDRSVGAIHKDICALRAQGYLTDSNGARTTRLTEKALRHVLATTSKS